MEIDEQKQGAVTVLRPKGPLVEADAPVFAKRVREVVAGSLGRVVIDAKALPFLDSAGLETLVDLAEELGESGLTLRLCAVNETVREVFELTGTSGLFEYHEDSTAAVRSFL
ncbi:MAG: STAS domain-containing protein [Phycisphaerales bacterium]